MLSCGLDNSLLEVTFAISSARVNRVDGIGESRVLPSHRDILCKVEFRQFDKVWDVVLVGNDMNANVEIDRCNAVSSFSHIVGRVVIVIFIAVEMEQHRVDSLWVIILEADGVLFGFLPDISLDSRFKMQTGCSYSKLAITRLGEEVTAKAYDVLVHLPFDSAAFDCEVGVSVGDEEATKLYQHRGPKTQFCNCTFSQSSTRVDLAG